MGEQYQVAFDFVTKYRALNTTDKGDVYEESELLLFQNRCLEKMGKFTEAIDHLKQHEDSITDKLSIKVKTAQLNVLLGNFDTAKEQWLALVKSQPDNYRFHSGVQAAYLQLDATAAGAMFQLTKLDLPSTVLNLDAAQLSTLKALYAELMAHTKRSAANKIVMGLSRGADEVRATLDTFMRNSLHHAIPSLVQDICALVRIPDPHRPERIIFATDPVDFRKHEVVTIALSLVEGYIANLKQCGQFDAAAPASKPEPPTALLWALYFQCHFLEQSGEVDRALAVIDEAIAHTPTALDMHSKRARLLKKQGDLTAAAVEMDNCRALDLQDRYLNNKATKYFLRADETPLAMNTIAMFTKHEGDPQQTLYELQCNWYELELAESYARTRQWGAALRKFYAIRKHFMDYNNDMFDFHGYCMRKVRCIRVCFLCAPYAIVEFCGRAMSLDLSAKVILFFLVLQTTLRAYFDTVAMMDNSFAHKFYQRATRGALRIFLYLHEFPEDVDGLGHLPPEQRKKERMKLKKAKKKNEEKLAEEAAAAAESGDKDKEDKKKAKKDLEPDEDTLLTKDFMAEAVAWTAVVGKRLTLCDAETIALLCDLNVRRGEYMAAVDAVRVGLQRFPNDPALAHSLVRLAAKVKNPGKKTLGPSAPEIREAVTKLLGCAAGQIDVETFLTSYTALALREASLPMIFAVIKSRVALDKTGAATLEAIRSLLADSANWQGRGLKASLVVEVTKVNSRAKFCHIFQSSMLTNCVH